MKRGSVAVGAIFAVLAVVAVINCNRRLRDETGAAAGDASTTSAELAMPEKQGGGAEGQADAAVTGTTAEAVKDGGPSAAPTPAWVPDAGRLSIVGASDLPRNLGLVGPDGGAIAAPTAPPPAAAPEVAPVEPYRPPSAADRVPRSQF